MTNEASPQIVPDAARVVREEAAASRLDSAMVDMDERQERIGSRAARLDEETNLPIEEFEPGRFRAADKRRRLEKYYGTKGLRRFDSWFAAAETRGNLSWVDEAKKKGLKILVKGGIAGGLGLAAAGILGGGVAIPAALIGVGAGVGVRALWETGRVAFGTERRARNEVERANEAVIKKIEEMVDELEQLRVDISGEPTTPGATEIEQDPRYKSLMSEIVEMMYDDTARRTRKTVGPRGKVKYEGLRKGEGIGENSEQEEDIINVGERERGLVKRERKLEATGDILTATASVGASVLGGLYAAKEIGQAAVTSAHQAGQQAAQQAGEKLGHGATIGKYDFDGVAIPDGVKDHMVQVIQHGVRPYFDHATHIWHDSVVNLQSAIGSLAEKSALVQESAIANAKIFDLTRGLIGAGAASLAQFFAGRLGHKDIKGAEKFDKMKAAGAVELINRQTGSSGEVLDVNLPEAEKDDNRLNFGSIIHITTNADKRKALGISDYFRDTEYFYIEGYRGTGDEAYAEIRPLVKDENGKFKMYQGGGRFDLSAEYLKRPLGTDITNIARADLEEPKADSSGEIAAEESADADTEEEPAPVAAQEKLASVESPEAKELKELIAGNPHQVTINELDNGKDEEFQATLKGKNRKLVFENIFAEITPKPGEQWKIEIISGSRSNDILNVKGIEKVEAASPVVGKKEIKTATDLEAAIKGGVDWQFQSLIKPDSDNNITIHGVEVNAPEVPMDFKIRFDQEFHIVSVYQQAGKELVEIDEETIDGKKIAIPISVFVNFFLPEDIGVPNDQRKRLINSTLRRMASNDVRETTKLPESVSVVEPKGPEPAASVESAEPEPSTDPAETLTLIIEGKETKFKAGTIIKNGDDQLIIEGVHPPKDGRITIDYLDGTDRVSTTYTAAEYAERFANYEIINNE